MDTREKRIRFALILVIVLAVFMAFTVRFAKKEKIIYRKSLEQAVLVVDGAELTLRDIAFYVAYEEKSIQKQAVLYSPDNPNEYWNLHANGQFVRTAAKQAVIDMAVHDEIFYKMALDEEMTLDETDKSYLENEEMDFWADLEEWQKERLGIGAQDLEEAMKKIALANKYQSIYAQMNDEEYEAYNYDGKAYAKLLEQHEYGIKETVWDRVDMGNITLDNY